MKGGSVIVANVGEEDWAFRFGFLDTRSKAWILREIGSVIGVFRIGGCKSKLTTVGRMGMGLIGGMGLFFSAFLPKQAEPQELNIQS